MSEPRFKKNAIALNISREMALIHGMVEPTDEERAEMDRRAAEYAVREREAWEVYDAARAALDAITEQPARAVLDLHRWTDVEFPRCDGCDMDGYDCEQPTWPCRTTEAIAAHYGIVLPDFRLWRRP